MASSLTGGRHVACLTPSSASARRPARHLRGFCMALLALCWLALGSGPVSASGRQATPRSGARPRASVTAMLAGVREINYYPAANGWTAMWTAWNPAQIDADFARIADLHATVVRVIIQTGAFGYPTPQPAMLDRLARVVALAASHGLRVHLTLFDWWDGYGDLAGSRRWAQAVVGPYAGDARVAIVELKNEIDPSNAAAMAWTRAMLPFLRQIDGGIPVTVSLSGSAGPAGMQRLVSALQGAAPDFYDYHYYGPAEAAYQELARVRQIVAPAPLFVGEVGFSTDPSSAAAYDLPPGPTALEAFQDHYLRTINAATAALGLPPAAPWTLYDFAPGAIPGSAVASQPREYHFGLYRVDGTAKPVAASIAAFFASSVPVTSFNNGFEDAVSAGGVSLPAQWRLFHAGQAQFARDATVAHSGVASARISASGGDALGLPAFYLAPVDARVTPGRVYTARVWARGRAATGYSAIALAWFDAAGSYLGSTESPPLLPGTSSTWMQLTASGAAPAGAARVQIHLKSGHNSGTVWFDDVSFMTHPS